MGKQWKQSHTLLWGGSKITADGDCSHEIKRLLGVRTEETGIERDMCNLMFIAALFIVARIWKQPRCPSADEWIRKLWDIYTMEYYSAIKRIHLNQF